MKQYILVRTDIKVPIGKIIAHAGHNVLIVYKENEDNFADDYNLWDWYENHNQTKIVVDGGDEKDIWRFIGKTRKIEAPYSFIEDIHIKKRICAVIGPVSNKEAKYLGLDKLPLYK